MRNCIFLLFIFVLTSTALKSQKFEWVKSFGGKDFEAGSSMEIDNGGNIYISGTFEGTVDFDPGVDTTYLTSAGEFDFFVQKLDSEGNLIWVKSFGGLFYDESADIKLDNLGNMYILGSFSGTVDFDPGSDVHVLSGLFILDLFLLKLDSDGNLVWVKTFDGTGPVDGAELTFDAFGNIHIIGSFYGAVEFYNGADTTRITSVDNLDVFILKLDFNGEFLWVKSIGGKLDEFGGSINIDFSGNVITSMIFSDTINYWTGSENIIFIPKSDRDFLVQKFDKDGNFIWVHTFGGTGVDICRSIVLDKSDNLLITGYYADMVDFDPGPQNFFLTSKGEIDVFLCKLDGEGNFIWAKSFGGVGYDAGQFIKIDISGDIVFSGMFQDTVVFNNEINSVTLVTNGYSDVFIMQLDSLANYKWIKSFGGMYYDEVHGMQLDLEGNIYNLGVFAATVDFDPGPGTEILSSPDYFQIYVHKMSPCKVPVLTDEITSCEPYTWINGVTYNTSNTTAVHFIQNVFGCDTMIKLNLTIHQPSIGTDEIIACEEYTWINGVTYTTSDDTTTHVIQNVFGCDSIVKLNLTIHQPSFGTDNITACEEYTWINGVTYTTSDDTTTHVIQNVFGCDSIVKLNLTIHQPSFGTDEITACEEYKWINGITYTSSNNTATTIILNEAGCDSIVSLNLKIENVSDNRIFYNGETINALNENASFRWLDCDRNFEPIPGQSNQSFLPLESGNYAVEITENECIDTSSCLLVILVGVNDINPNLHVNAYPNPNFGDFVLHFNQVESNVEISIYDVTGKIISGLYYEKCFKQDVLLPYPAGIYFLKIQSKDQNAVLKIIKL